MSPPNDQAAPHQAAHDDEFQFDNWRFIDTAIKAVYPILIAILSWATMEVIAHGNRLTALESSRYSQTDAANDQKALVARFEDMAKALHSIDRQVAELVARQSRNDKQP